MKRIIVAMASFVLSIGCCAQDMIVKKDGSIIQAKVSEIGTSEVKYKKWSNQDGPSYAIAKSDILAITYQNGEKETFAVELSEEPTAPPYIQKPADANNSTILAKYNTTISGIKGIKETNKKANGFWGILAFTPESVLSNEDIEINFVYGNYANVFSIKVDYYLISIKNKTTSIIYLDLANCFRTQTGIGSYCYFSGRTTSVTTGSASTTGVGVSVLPFAGIHSSNTSFSGVTRNFDEKQFIAIPPKGEIFVNKLKNEVTDKGGFFKEPSFSVMEAPELFSNYLTEDGKIIPEDGMKNFPAPDLRIGESRLFSESESPYHRTYMFTYSKDKSLATYSIINFELYLKQAIGVSTINGDEGTKSEKKIEGFTPNTIVMVRAIGKNQLEKMASSGMFGLAGAVVGSRR